MESDSDLILRAKRGEKEAFEELVRRYDQWVLSLALRLTGDEDDAKDVYQEVFIRVYRALGRFQERSRFSTWLYRIALNVCHTHRARKARHAFVSLDQATTGQTTAEKTLGDSLAAPDRSAEQGVILKELASYVKSAVNDLSPRQKTVFVLRHYHGLKLREIASLLECAEGTVKRHLFCATEKLRESLLPMAEQRGIR